MFTYNSWADPRLCVWEIGHPFNHHFLHAMTAAAVSHPHVLHAKVYKSMLVQIMANCANVDQDMCCIWRHFEVIGYMAHIYVTWWHRSTVLRLWLVTWQYQAITWANVDKYPCLHMAFLERNELSCTFIVRRAGLLWSQQDFEWRWSVPLFKCLTVLEFSFILFDLCLLITFFNFIMNYVPIVTFWIFTYHKIWILSIMFCFIWSYWIIYFLACLEVSWRVVS